MSIFAQKDPAVSLVEQWTARWRTARAPYDWKWPSRYVLAAGMLVACTLVFMWFSSEGVNEWVAIGLPAFFAIWALVIVRELGWTVLALTGATTAWFFAKDFERTTWYWIAGIAFVGYWGHMQDRTVSRLRAEIDELRRRISLLEQRP